MTVAPIEVSEVWFAYSSGACPVLRNVSFSVRRGEFLGVLGPNGAGKSTLLRLMAGLSVPSSGRVCISGRDTRSMSRTELARRVALVPQRETAAFGFTVWEVVAMGRAPHTGLLGTLSEKDRSVVDAALARCDAAHLSRRHFGELSGGEQKRVLVARALAQQCSVILLDEPVAHLDIKHQLDLCELLACGVASGEFTAVAVLHDLNLAAQFCDRLLLLRDGGTVALGTVEEVMTYRRVRDTFDAEVYVGQNEINGTRFFVPMRVR